MLLLLAAVDPIDTAERAQVMIERGPQTAVAAIFMVLFAVSAWWIVRLQQTHLRELNALHVAHGAKLGILYAEERERAVKLEVTLHGLLLMMDDFRTLAEDARRKRQRSSDGPFKPPGT